MPSTKIFFPCPKCGSIDTYCKGMEHNPTHMAAAYGVDMELVCKNCQTEFSENIFTPDPYDFTKAYNNLPYKENVGFKLETALE